jgi:hypothetical protein
VESTLRLSGGGEGALLEGERDRFATGGAAMVGVVLCKLLVRTTVHRVDAMKMTRALKISRLQIQVIVKNAGCSLVNIALRQSLPRF